MAQFGRQSQAPIWFTPAMHIGGAIFFRPAVFHANASHGRPFFHAALRGFSSVGNDFTFHSLTYTRQVLIET
jgi:hypothetical protein